MGARMLPVREALRGLPRAVRELSIRLGKDVDFVLQGEGVEADKAVVEGLFEPLLHLIRNALDHGIEPEQTRRNAGKPVRGRIDLRVRRQGDKIHVEIADDGRGIDPTWIRQVARGRGLHHEDALVAMSEAELVDLIFSPGFSTAGTVTDVSGRGVGMDAVRVAVEQLGGSVGVSSVPGEGTTIRLALPVTVMLTQIMVVRVGAESFGIPIDAIVETARLSREQVLPIGNGEAFVFRDKTVPLLYLSRLLHGGGAHPQHDLRALLVSLGTDLVGVAVDGFGERMDIMLRPMTGILAGMSGYAGTALRGDGSVLMILDLPELMA
jgi:two-component system chemotaxis sensor kinase CheA